MRAWANRVRTTFPLDNDRVNPSGQPGLLHLESATEPSWVGVDAIRSFIGRMQSDLEHDIHRVSMNLRLYIEDERTVDVLLKHVQDRVVDDCMDFSDLTSKLHNGVMRSKAPTMEYVRTRVLRGSAEDWEPKEDMRPPNSSSSSGGGAVF